jgi:hypothetical protein
LHLLRASCVFGDEQAHDPCLLQSARDAANYKNGVGCGKWTHIDGWSELVIGYIRALEQPTGEN